jgi:hypothetical protein
MRFTAASGRRKKSNWCSIQAINVSPVEGSIAPSIHVSQRVGGFTGEAILACPMAGLADKPQWNQPSAAPHRE